MGNHHGQHAPGATHEPTPLDPENDIDARSAAIWVIGGTIVFFLSMWLMLPVFTRVQEEEHRRKVEEAPTVELQGVLATQRQFLDGHNPKGLKIDQVMKDLAAGK